MQETQIINWLWQHRLRNNFDGILGRRTGERHCVETERWAFDENIGGFQLLLRRGDILNIFAQKIRKR